MDTNIRQAKAIFIQRYATAEEWKTRNPILYPGEIGIESDTGIIKVGREVSMPWNSIDYVNSVTGDTGEDGKSIFIRYSFSPDGTNYTENWSLGQNYLGIAIGYEAPNNKEDYEWSLFASNVSEPTAITLSADGWEDNLQIVNVPGIGSNSGVFATAHPDNLELYIQNGIFLEEASFGKATFSCTIVPTVDIKANIIIIEPIIDGDALPDFSESEDKSVLAYIDGEPCWVQINVFPELRGEQGPKGDTGETGADGADGADGVGITSIQKTGTAGLVDTYTIYFSNETNTTFEVTNGAQGDSGSVETIIVDTAEELPATATDGSMAVILEFSGGNNNPSEDPREIQYAQDDFSLGLWNRSERKLGTFYDCENMAGGLDTCISSRIPRRKWINLSDPIQGMFCSKDHLYFASDGELMMSLSENRVQVLGVMTTETKVFAALGRNVLVLPDFKVYDTVTERLSPKYVRLDLKGASLQNNKTIYCTSYDFTSYFVAGDGIRIAATNSNNGYFTIRSVEKNYLHFDENTFITETFPSTIYVLLEAPDMKGACTAMNRVWGWYGDDNGGSSTLIYASAPENIARWYRYDNDAESSYKVKVLSDVALTACVSFSDRPIFFSDTSMIEVVGESPANFKLVETSMHGVKPGCAASLCVVGDKMLYISNAGVVSCDGKTATVISGALGKNFVSGVATSDGRRYYLSAEDEQGVKALYIYDTLTGSWFKEDDKNNIQYLGYLNGDVFAYCSNLIIYILGENKTGHGTMLGAVSSYVEFHPLEHPAHTEIIPKSIELQVDCEADAILTLSIRYDDGEWEECGQLQSEGKQLWPISLEERTCRSLGIRLDGVGAYKVLYLGAECIGDALSDIPPITVRDVGKVLTAGEDGMAEWKESTGGSALPTITNEDNGKFLRVVDGAIALVALQDVSKEGA